LSLEEINTKFDVSNERGEPCASSLAPAQDLCLCWLFIWSAAPGVV